MVETVTQRGVNLLRSFVGGILGSLGLVWKVQSQPSAQPVSNALSFDHRRPSRQKEPWVSHGVAASRRSVREVRPGGGLTLEEEAEILSS